MVVKMIKSMLLDSHEPSPLQLSMPYGVLEAYQLQQFCGTFVPDESLPFPTASAFERITVHRSLQRSVDEGMV